MNAKDVIRTTIGSSEFILNAYLKDLSDADLRAKPVAGMNPLAWQLGHLIGAERWFVEKVKPGTAPPLPEGFEQAHSKESAASGDASGFRTKEEYLAIWKPQREASLAALESLPDGALDQPTEIPFAPTVGALMNMVGSHVLMHAGQFAAVRRSLGKPVAI
jgi:hypothetical protein